MQTPPAARAGGTMDSRGDLPVAVSFSRYTSGHDMVIIAIALFNTLNGSLLPYDVN